MKKLAELSQNPEHCRKVWNEVTNKPTEEIVVTSGASSLTIFGDSCIVQIDFDGGFTCESYGEYYQIYPLPLAALLTKLGYGIGVECPTNQDNDNMR